MYESDQDLLDKWHIEAGSGLENCVNRTMSDFEKFKVETKLIYRDGRVVGYFGKETNNGMQALTGFFIDPEFRNSEHIPSIWNEIREDFCPAFFVGLFDHNEPARKFIERQGGKELVKQENKVLYLIDNRES